MRVTCSRCGQIVDSAAPEVALPFVCPTCIGDGSTLASAHARATIRQRSQAESPGRLGAERPITFSADFEKRYRVEEEIGRASCRERV